MAPSHGRRLVSHRTFLLEEEEEAEEEERREEARGVEGRRADFPRLPALVLAAVARGGRPRGEAAAAGSGSGGCDACSAGAGAALVKLAEAAAAGLLLGDWGRGAGTRSLPRSSSWGMTRVGWGRGAEVSRARPCLPDEAAEGAEGTGTLLGAVCRRGEGRTLRLDAGGELAANCDTRRLASPMAAAELPSAE